MSQLRVRGDQWRRHCALGLGVGLLFGSPLASGDQVFTDDIIAQKSACVGNDCVDGEDFDFDTIRIKENNLRLHADDTSGTASFPGTDWRLVFNDSANGGANKFAIEDVTAATTPFTIEGGTPDNTLYVDAEGRIGIGTSTPVVDIHDVSGNSPTLRLEQDGSSGFTAQIWDVAGNETNFFVRDTTHDSQLPFRIAADSPSDSIWIKTAQVELRKTLVDGDLTVTGDVNVQSDGRLKTGVVSIETAGDRITKLDGKQYRWLADEHRSGEEDKLGFIAQEVEAVLPQLVSENDDGIKSVNYLGIIPLLVNALKDQISVTDEQALRIEMLTEEMASQRALLEQLQPPDTALTARQP
jgi:hypothetical protein